MKIQSLGITADIHGTDHLGKRPRIRGWGRGKRVLSANGFAVGGERDGVLFCSITINGYRYQRPWRIDDTYGSLESEFLKVLRNSLT